MKTKSLFFTLVLLALGGSLSAQVGQQGIASNPLGGDLTATSAGCATVQSCVWMRLPNNGSTATVTLAGTFAQTDLIELSGDGGNTWITNATLSAVGITSVSVSGFSDIRVRCSAFTSGRASVTINVGLLQVQSVVSGSSSSSPSSLGGNGGFFTSFMGFKPDDCGNATCTQAVTIRYLKFCTDGAVSGQPTTTFTSGSTKTLTNSARTGGTATYTFANTTVSGVGVLIGLGQTLSVTGSNNTNGALNITNAPVVSATATQVTVAFAGATIASAADTGTITTLGAGNVGCGNFQSADATSTLEIVGETPANFPGATGGLSTTISSVTNPTSVVVGTSMTTNATGMKFWFGTDATVATQNWAAAVSNGVPGATGLLTHQGYLPGLYLITKPIRIINPFVPAGAFTYSGNQGYGPPEPFAPNDNENEGMAIWGGSSYRNGFVAGSQFNWQFPSASVNNGIFYMNGWNGNTLQNFFVGPADYASMAFNTTTNTGTIACFMDDNNSHSVFSGIQVENCHNTTTSLFGHNMNGIFGNVLTNSQFYRNDCGSSFSPIASGGGAELTVENVTFWMQGSTSTTCNPLELNGPGWSNSNFINSNIYPGSGSGVAGIKVNNGMTTALASDAVKFTNVKVTCAGNQECVVIASGVTSAKFGFSNVNLDSSGTASGFAILNQSAGVDLHYTDGAISCTAACANGISNATGSTIHMVGTRILGTVGIVGTGAAAVSQTIDTATGWSGPGTFRSTQTLSDQGAVCTVGELVLSAGWQSTGSATVTAVSGNGQTCKWTITTGTTTAPNPTVTDTLTNALPAATTVCELNIHGGTHTAVAGEGFDQTTLSATAPIFTANFTPTAGGTTYLVTRRCGP